MKQIYEEPVVEIIEFTTEDVLLDSNETEILPFGENW